MQIKREGPLILQRQGFCFSVDSGFVLKTLSFSFYVHHFLCCINALTFGTFLVHMVISCSHKKLMISFFCLPSEDAMEYSKEFVTSVVLGKDLVPRYLFCYIQCSVINFTLLQCNTHICLFSLSGSAFLNWRVCVATFWKSYRKVTSQR